MRWPERRTVTAVYHSYGGCGRAGDIAPRPSRERVEEEKINQFEVLQGTWMGSQRKDEEVDVVSTCLFCASSALILLRSSPVH